jgi:hypothetical protein
MQFVNHNASITCSQRLGAVRRLDVAALAPLLIIFFFFFF